MRFYRKCFILIIMCLLAVALSSCGNNVDSENNGGRLHDWAAEYYGSGLAGLTLGLVNDHELSHWSVVFLDNITDNLNVQFANLTERDSEYILKLFYDYEEIPFKVDGGDIWLESYVFTLNSMSSMVIPINLKEDLHFENSHFLTVAVLTAPNVHAVDLDMMSNSYGVCMTFELTNRNGTRQANAKPTAQESMAFLELPFQGLMLNLDFDAKDDNQVLFPPKEIRAKSDETVKLAYRVGNYENTDDVLFIVLVDWQPQIINGKPFVHITNKPGYISYGVIEITIPSEKGKYEITGFVDYSPFALRNENTAWGNETCYRFTLVVE